VNAPQKWKTVQYHGKQIHVCAVPRAHENEALSGHAQQWEFMVKITANTAVPLAEESENVRSDPALAYSTQAIAEDMGFIKGRELIAGI
jgi:hypothetical protein